MPPAALAVERPNERPETTTRSNEPMSGGTFARVLAALVLIGVVVAIGVGVYNAGVSAGLATTVAAPSGAPVTYYPGPYAWHGWGWGPGWGFFGIFFWILGIFLIFGLLRAVFGW